MRLYDVTHHTSGIIVFQSGLTQAFDWGMNVGLPRDRMGEPAFQPSDATVIACRRDADLGLWLDLRRLVVVYDPDHRLPLKPNTLGNVYLLSDGTTVLAPRRWA